MSSNIESLQISDQEIKQITGCKALLYEPKKIVRKNRLSLEYVIKVMRKEVLKVIVMKCFLGIKIKRVLVFDQEISALAFGGLLIVKMILLLYVWLISIVISANILGEFPITVGILLFIFGFIGYLISLRKLNLILLKKQIEKINNIPPTLLGILLDEVDKFNKAAKQMDVVNQLEAVGNKGVFKDKDKVINALISVKEDLIRALKTERILRENPEFNAAQLSVDLTALRALDIGEQT